MGEALEQNRRQSLLQNVGKKTGALPTRAEEIDCLERKLACTTCSAAAASGIRKRLQTLKAAELKAERNAAVATAAAAAAAAAVAHSVGTTDTIPEFRSPERAKAAGAGCSSPHGAGNSPNYPLLDTPPVRLLQANA